MQEQPHSLNCRGAAHITSGIEDVTTMTLHFSKERSAIIHSSWHDPRKVREMTIVGSKRMIVYDDIAAQEKVKVFDVRVERPPHYDTFAEFHYAYHYGDTYCPFVKQDEPLRTECQHFLDSIVNQTVPLTCGRSGREVVRILEAANASLKRRGAPIDLDLGVNERTPSRFRPEATRFEAVQTNGHNHNSGNGHPTGTNGARAKINAGNGGNAGNGVHRKRVYANGAAG
jgi:hypothetical protein